jgi:hypothetical protein
MNGIISELAKWDSFYCHRRLGCGGTNRIAVRRHDTHCRETTASCGGGRRRVWDADDRSFQRRFTSVSARRALWETIIPAAVIGGLIGFSGVAYAVTVARRMPTGISCAVLMTIADPLAGMKCAERENTRQLDLELNVAVLIEIPEESIFVVLDWWRWTTPPAGANGALREPRANGGLCVSRECRNPLHGYRSRRRSSAGVPGYRKDERRGRRRAPGNRSRGVGFLRGEQFTLGQVSGFPLRATSRAKQKLEIRLKVQFRSAVASGYGFLIHISKFR